MAEHEAERDLLVEALLLLRQRQVELEQRVTALEAESGSTLVEPSAALRGLVDELRGSAPAAREPAVQTQPEQAVATTAREVLPLIFALAGVAPPVAERTMVVPVYPLRAWPGPWLAPMPLLAVGGLLIAAGAGVRQARKRTAVFRFET